VYRLARQKEIIRQATATVGEIEEVGAEIVENLGKNREKIASAQGKVREWTCCEFMINHIHAHGFVCVL
jgi:hypothetical protein